jgi:hypothetical protein
MQRALWNPTSQCPRRSLGCRSVWVTALICAISTVALGWKYTRIFAIPVYEQDSMRSVWFTIVVMTCSQIIAMRLALPFRVTGRKARVIPTSTT